jgi:hypothetical protein
MDNESDDISQSKLTSPKSVTPSKNSQRIIAKIVDEQLKNLRTISGITILHVEDAREIKIQLNDLQGTPYEDSNPVLIIQLRFEKLKNC